MADHKPLPALPISSNLSSLTVDARAHRARLIRHLLAELPDPAIHSRHDGWAYAIEDALDDLSACLVRGDWLAGIRRRRQSKHRATLDSVLADNTLRPEPKTLKDTPKSRPQSPNPSPHPLPSLGLASADTARPTRTRVHEVLQQLRAHISRSSVPTTDQRQFHLVLCLAPSGARAYLPPDDHGFDVIPANIGCAFVSSKFLLPADPDHAETTVLFGINEWDDIPKLRIVGGTFTFKGVDTLTQHSQLAQALRISIYIHLSLLLEQHFLSDSHVPLKFPRPKLAFPSSSAPSEKDLKPQPSRGTSEDPKPSPPPFPARSPFLPHGILSFFSRKKGLSHRAQTVNQTGSRGALDLISNASALGPGSVPPRSPSTSIDGTPAGVSRLRRFSLIGGGGAGAAGGGHEWRASSRRSAQASRDGAPRDGSSERGHAQPESTDGPFAAALKRVKRSKSLLSTSVGVTFLPPSLLVDLAEREAKAPNRRLKGDERVALASILGWTGKDPPGRGMSGIPGFVRQQEFSFLQSQHVPASQIPPAIHPLPPPMATPAVTPTPVPTPNPNHAPSASASTTASTSTSLSSCPDPQSTLSAIPVYPSANAAAFTLCCGRPLWRTYRYFSRDSGEDQPLGEAVSELVATADLPCIIPGCLFKVREHERRIVHGGVQITITIKEDVHETDKGKEREESGEGIAMWESCRVCEKESARVGMSDGTYLFSYAKFLEVLIYSPLSPSLCEHTTLAPPPPNLHPQPNPTQSTHEFPLYNTPTPSPRPQIPQSKLNLIRHFNIRNATVSFSLTNVENIFALKGPRLQINGGAELERERERGRGREKEHRREREREREREKGKEVSSADQHRPSTQEKEKEKEKGSGVIADDGAGGGDHGPPRVDDAGSMEEAKKVLRREIRRWWEGIADHLDKLERLLAGGLVGDEEGAFKRLPRLPSVDDAYDDFDEGDGKGEEDEEAALTPKPPAAKELPMVDASELEVTDSEADEEDVTKTPRRSRSENLSLPDTPAGEDEDKTPTVSKIRNTPSIVTTSAEDSPQETSASVSTSTLSSMNTETTTTSTLTASTCDDKDPRELLENLRHKFQRAEHSLYVQLLRVPDNSLNDVRRTFLATAKGAQKRLGAWQRKHLVRLVKVGELRVDECVLKELGVKELKELVSGKEGRDEGKGMARCVEPDWWGGGAHVLPGSSVIVREDDLGSIIAFTLSSPDYHRELTNLAVSRTGVSTPPPLATPPPPAPTPSRNFSTVNASSFFTSTTGKLFGTFTNGAQPDPDQDDVVWYEPEPYSTLVTRKEHPRDATSILSIREVLRHREKSPALDPVTGAQLSLALSGANESLQQSGLALASVYAKPDVRVSMQAADGEVSVLSPAPGQGQGQGQGQGEEDPAGKMLHEIEAVANGEGSRPRTAESHAGTGHSRFDGTATTDVSKRASGSTVEGVHAPAPMSPFLDRSGLGTAGCNVDTHIRRANAESILASFGGGEGMVARRMERAPTPPPKEGGKGKGKEGFLGVGELKSGTGTPAMKDLPATPGGSAIHHLAASSSSFANTIASSLNMAMRFVLNQPESKPASAHPPPVPKKQPHHNLLLVDANNIDERPHIKYDWTIGKRLKFSCTVYYARQFDLMRKRCGIDDSFLKSLERCVNWTAVGGKSRSNFWKTLDERFIIKTLVNAWNVADLQVLIELGPSYFRYIESTASKATVLVKLIGFYTIEIRNLETGAVQSKADLLVMENLFHNHKINKTFDLKGIQGRKVKAKQNGPGGSRTLFDNEWIEGQQRTFMLLQPHSKHVLREAIRSDADFLAKSNIMDYSLLLGIDDEEKQIACGLVDTIGSYTFAKTLEYKAKHNLHSGKDVTVIPPAEYQDRFVNALEDYFLACPDKWSKSLDETKTVSDPFLLPSVL